jgi:hypothetical protein
MWLTVAACASPAVFNDPYNTPASRARTCPWLCRLCRCLSLSTASQQTQQPCLTCLACVALRALVSCRGHPANHLLLLLLRRLLLAEKTKAGRQDDKP